MLPIWRAFEGLRHIPWCDLVPSFHQNLKMEIFLLLNVLANSVQNGFFYDLHFYRAFPFVDLAESALLNRRILLHDFIQIFAFHDFEYYLKKLTK